MKLLFISLLLSMAAAGQKTSPQTFQKDGKAIQGYDAVAFFLDSAAVKGNELFSYQWNDATWLFSSQNNLDSFKKAPGKYEPQYGGYCAYGMAGGYKAPTSIDTWTIVNGKLYFNYNMQVKEIWNKKRPEYIEEANKKWPDVKHNK
jgi:YHS domain-containing protein